MASPARQQWSQWARVYGLSSIHHCRKDDGEPGLQVSLLCWIDGRSAVAGQRQRALSLTGRPRMVDGLLGGERDRLNRQPQRQMAVLSLFD